jgi:hypothetical protein
MKKMFLAIVSLTAIAILSCSTDSSNPLAEEMNLPQSQTLQKASPGIPLYELQFSSESNELQTLSKVNVSAPEGNGMYTAFYCGSMSVSGVPYNGYAWTSVAECDFTSIRDDAWNTEYQFIGTGPSSSGTFSPQFIRIQCGDWWGDFTPWSYANISTTAFAGTPASVRCYMAIYGKCAGTPYGGGTCSYSVSSIKGYQWYSY